MLMPSHAKNVKHYADVLPLFSRFQVESYLSAMFNPTVQLKSGGYIVIDVTEALVAIDVNSGRATREASIEDTALKTNMEAAEEAARQMRLRDLAGLIVIDFIDMEDRSNNAAVEKKLKDKLKTDRARIQVGRISAFGLLEMCRQRLRPGMIEARPRPARIATAPAGSAPTTRMALALLREIEEEGVSQRSKEVLIVAPGRDRQLPAEPEARAYRDDRGPLRPLGPRRGRSLADQPRLQGREVQDRLADHPGACDPRLFCRRCPTPNDVARGERTSPEEEEETTAEPAAPPPRATAIALLQRQRQAQAPPPPVAAARASRRARPPPSSRPPTSRTMPASPTRMPTRTPTGADAAEDLRGRSRARGGARRRGSRGTAEVAPSLPRRPHGPRPKPRRR